MSLHCLSALGITTMGLLSLAAAQQPSPVKQLPLARDADEIAQLVESMTAVERERLRKQQARFQKESPDQQRAYRHLHKELTSSPRAEALMRTLEAYVQWLAELTPEQRDRIRQLPPKERIQEIEVIQREQEEAWLEKLASGIERADAVAIWGFLREQLRLHETAVLESLSKDDRRFIERLNRPIRLRALLRKMIQNPTWTTWVTEPDWRRLERSLSDEARNAWSQASDDDRKHELIRHWVSTRRFGTPPAPPERLQEFYLHQLSPAERAELNALPTEELIKALRDRFQQQP